MKKIVSNLKENNIVLENQVTRITREYMNLQKRFDNIQKVNTNLTKRVYEAENLIEAKLLRLETYVNKSYSSKNKVYKTCSDAMKDTFYRVSGNFLLVGAEKKAVSIYCEVSGDKGLQTVLNLVLKLKLY